MSESSLSATSGLELAMKKCGVVFSKSILFILVLVFSYQLMENALLNILITHLTDEWKHEELSKAVIVVSLQEGAFEVLQIFFAFFADAYTGPVVMLISSTILSVAGLLLSFASTRKAGHFDFKLFCTALFLMALSQAAKKVTLKAFLGDQLVPRDRQASADEEERAKKSSNFWWILASCLASIVALFGASRIDSLRILSILLASVMGASLLWFLMGIRLYSCSKPTGSSLSDVIFVIYSAVVKRNVERHPDIPIPPNIHWLRWLDRAAAVEKENKHTRACSVEQVKGVKFLIKMVPMWTTFCIFCLVSSSGKTFFLQEVTSIIDDDLPIIIFLIFPRSIESAVSRICIFLLKKLGYKLEENTTQRMKLVRIGLGMLCCVPCCIAAWINSVHRLNFPTKQPPRLHNYVILLRLFPQFYLLALMERLSTHGLQQFFDSQVSKSISRYGPPIGEFVIGFSKFFGVIFILLLSKWFGWFEDTVTNSHLDKYYGWLAYVSFINFIFYCLVAHWYGEDTFLSEEDDKVKAEDDIEMAISEALESRSLSCTRQLEEGSFGDDLTDNISNNQLQKSLPLLELETVQETTVSHSASEATSNASLLVVSEGSISRVCPPGVP